jgi:cytochrome b pre-mRNA-processing protein 3
MTPDRARQFSMGPGEDRLVNTMQRSRQSPPIAVRVRHWLRRFWPDPADRARREVADRLYRDLVKQARMPAFYRDLGVPDTPEGRFEMVGLHVALAVRRLRAAGAPGSALGQELFDLMFADMDESLRHIGIGELSVGKHIKRLAGNFYARLRALDEALVASPDAPLAQMLRTNVYHGGTAPSPHQVAALVSYLLAADAALRTQPTERLLAGQLDWAPPGGATSKTTSEET